VVLTVSCFRCSFDSGVKTVFLNSVIKVHLITHRHVPVKPENKYETGQTKKGDISIEVKKENSIGYIAENSIGKRTSSNLKNLRTYATCVPSGKGTWLLLYKKHTHAAHLLQMLFTLLVT
jgi:hypothetical protein